MEVTYYGANCVVISTKGVTLLVDPLSGEYGPNPKVKADVTLFSQAPSETVNASGFVIDRPGEYEIKGVTIDGVAARLHTEESDEKKEAVMYAVSHKDLRILFCGNVHPNLSEEQIERVDGVDVLVVPVGGNGLTLDKVAASEFVRQFDPSYVIPTHYDDGKTAYSVPQDGLEAFLHEVGAGEVSPEESFKLTSRDGSEETTFVVLKPKK